MTCPSESDDECPSTTVDIVGVIVKFWRGDGIMGIVEIHLPNSSAEEANSENVSHNEFGICCWYLSCPVL